MRTIQDKNRNIAIGFFALFTIGILNLFIPFAIFASISGINDFSYYLVFNLRYWFNLTQMIVHDTYQLIMTIVQIIIYLWILLNLKDIEVDLLAEEKHYNRTKKYFFYTFIYGFLILYQGFLLMIFYLIFFLIFLLLFFAIAGLVGTVYFAIFLYNIGKESENVIIKVGGILFIVGPILSALGIIVSLPTLFGAGSMEFNHIFFGIISFIDKLISGIGFLLLMNNYEGAKHERRTADPRASRRESRDVPRYESRRSDYPPSRPRSSLDFSIASEARDPSPAIPAQSSDQQRCPNCGSPCASTDKFCMNCGRYLEE